MVTGMAGKRGCFRCGAVLKEARHRAEDGSVRLPSPALGIAGVVQCKMRMR